MDILAVSEIVGSILLLSLSVVLVSVVGLFMSEYPMATDTPRTELIGAYSQGNVTIIHQGGDTLLEEDTEIVIEIRNDRTYELNISNGLDGKTTWNMGNIWRFRISLYNGTLPGLDDIVTVIVFDRLSQKMLLNQQVSEGPPLGFLPDIEVRSRDVWLNFTGDSLQAGEEATISARVFNVGNWPADNVVIRIFAEGEFLPPVGTISSLAPGANDTVSVQWRPMSYGVWTISIQAVPQDWEFNYGNNYISIEQDVEVRADLADISGSDLMIEAGDIRFSPSTPNNGENVSIVVTLNNIGDVAVTDATVNLIDDEIGLIRQHTNVSVAAGSQVDLVSYWIATPGGLHSVTATADPFDHVDEILETNNEYTALVLVQPSILLVDDDNEIGGNERDSTSPLMDSLTGVGVEYDVHIVGSGYDGPGFLSGSHPLTHYDIVIWTCGYEESSTLTDDDLDSLSSFLNEGGFLWLIGQDVLDDISGSSDGIDFIEEHLHIDSGTISFDEGTPTFLEGKPGDPIGHGLRLNTSAVVSDGGDDIMPDGSASGGAVFGNISEGIENNTVRFYNESAGYKTVFQAWEFAGLARPSDRTLLTYRVLEWFNWSLSIGDDVAVTDMEFSLESPRYLDTVIISAVIRNNGATAVNTSVAFFVDETMIPSYPDYTGNPQPVFVAPAGSEVTVEKEWVASMPGDHVVRVMVDPYNLLSEVNEVNNDISYSLLTDDLLDVKEVVLVVDDDGSANNGGTDADHVSMLTETLNYLDYDYDIVVVGDGADGPDVDYLKHYNMVAWFTGENGRGVGDLTLSVSDQENLTLYLEGGYEEASYLGGLRVNLWLCGQDILYDITGGVSGPTGANTFERDVLHVASYIESVSMPDEVEGVLGDTITHGLEMVVNITGTNQADALVPTGDARTMLTDESDRCLGLRYNSSSYNLVFMPYEYSFAGWSNLTGSGAREEGRGAPREQCNAEVLPDSQMGRGCSSRTVIFTDGFESGVGSWSHGGDVDIWELGVPAYTGNGEDITEDHTAAPGSNCWGTDLDGSSDIGKDSECWLESPPVNLPAVGLTTLSYYIWYDLNTLDIDDDDAWLNITDDGGASWTQIDPPPGWPGWLNDALDGSSGITPSYEGSTGGQWKEVLLDLSAYNGETISLRWHFRDSSNDVTSFAGLYIDDVVIVTIPPNSVPVLESGKVYPEVGNTATEFSYQVRYTDDENEEPTSALVFIDGVPYAMTTADSTYSDGSLFTFLTTLSAGVHDYFFIFSDGHSNARLPTTGVYEGPMVSIAGGGSGGNETRAKELAYLILHWFGHEEMRPELRTVWVDINISSDHPVLGDSYIWRSEVYNPGGRNTNTIVRFLDGGTIVDTNSVFVPADGSTTVECIWTPLYAGSRTLAVCVDPGRQVEEVFEMNNNATLEIPVVFFFDDMENGSDNWDHDNTILRINGESALEYMDGTLHSDIVSDWAGVDGFSRDDSLYHSSNSSYSMSEPEGGTQVSGFRYEFYLPDDGVPGIYAIGINRSSTFDFYKADDDGEWQILYGQQSIGKGLIQYYPDLEPYYLYMIDSTGPLLIIKTSLEGSNVNIANFDTGSEIGRDFVALGKKYIVFALEPHTNVTFKRYNTVADHNISQSGGPDNWADKQDVYFDSSAHEGTYHVYAGGSSSTPVWIHSDKDVIAYRCSGDHDELDTAISTWGSSLGEVLYYPYVGDGHPPRIIVYNTGPSTTTVKITETTASDHYPPTGAASVVISNWNILAYGMDTYGWDATDPGVTVPAGNEKIRTIKVEITGGDTTGIKVVYGGVSGGKDDFDVTGDDGSADDCYDLFGFWDGDGKWRISSPLLVGGNGNEDLERRSQHIVVGDRTDIEVDGDVPIALLDNTLVTNKLIYFSVMDITLHYETMGTVTDVQLSGVTGATVDTVAKTIFLPKGKHSTSGTCLTITGTGSGTWYLGINEFSFDAEGSFAWQLKYVAEWDGVDYSNVRFMPGYPSSPEPGTFKYCWNYTSDEAFIFIIDGDGNCWIHTILPYEGSISKVGEQALLRRSTTDSRTVVGGPKTRTESNSTMVYMNTPPFTLENISSAKLSFYHKYDLFQAYNGGVIMVGTDDDNDGIWQYRYLPMQSYVNNLYLGETEYDDYGNLMRWCWNGISGAGTFSWDRVDVDLSDYAGNPRVRIKFVCILYDGGGGGGWWIDDVEVVVSRSDSVVVNGSADKWEMIETTAAHSGTHCWWNHNGVGPPATDHLKGGLDNSLNTRGIDLTGARNATLSAYFKFNINTSSGQPPDGFRVEVSSDNGVSWKAINLGVRAAWGVSGTDADMDDGTMDGKSYSGLDPDSDSWVEASTLSRLYCDLSGWVGQVVMIRFRVVTASDSNPDFGATHYEDDGAGFSGFYVDDVIVSGTSVQEGR